MNTLYDGFLDGLQKTADFVEKRLMTGFTRDYIAYMLGFLLVLLGVTAIRGAFFAADRLAAAGLTGVGGAAVGGADGAVALSVPFPLGWRGGLHGSGGHRPRHYVDAVRAPDLALTTLVVEPVTLLLFLLVFVYLPRLTATCSRDRPLGQRRAGQRAAAWPPLLLLGVRGLRADRTVADWYIENSLPLAHGANVVNVILVDFRGFDTMFEITVLALAGLGVYILSTCASRGTEVRSVILQTVTRLASRH